MGAMRTTERPTQITFRGLKPSEELKNEVRDRIAWLEQFYPPLMACRVRLQAPHRYRSHGRHMHVTIEMTVPRHPPVVITHEPSVQHARVAIHEAFDVARRRLKDSAVQ
jgi:ribosome-associated translation inhibitor RaiA